MLKRADWAWQNSELLYIYVYEEYIRVNTKSKEMINMKKIDK